jgi:hypothetical protein
MGFLLAFIYQTREKPRPVNIDVTNSCPQVVCPQFPHELPQLPLQFIEELNDKNNTLHNDLLKCKEDLGYYLNKAMNFYCPNQYETFEYPE